MEPQKGFSLLDLLVSLFILTTLTFSLIEQQEQAKQLLYQAIFTEQELSKMNR